MDKSFGNTRLNHKTGVMILTVDDDDDSEENFNRTGSTFRHILGKNKA